MKTLMAPVKSAERRTSVWSVFRAPVGEQNSLRALRGRAAGSHVTSEEHWPEGKVWESVESRLWHSASGISAPHSCGTMSPGCGAKMAEVTTALCAEKGECSFNTSNHRYNANTTVVYVCLQPIFFYSIKFDICSARSEPTSADLKTLEYCLNLSHQFQAELVGRLWQWFLCFNSVTAKKKWSTEQNRGWDWNQQPIQTKAWPCNQ